MIKKNIISNVQKTNMQKNKLVPIIKPLMVKSVVKPASKPVSKPTTKSLIVAKRVIAKPIVKPVVKSMLQQKVSKTPLKKITIPIQKENVVKTAVKKKKLVEVTPEHETYFVYLKNPLEYRRHLLESSRKILFCLKSHQKIFLIRQKKLEEMNKLKASVRELLYLNKKSFY